jgi:photosynthetic reaction center cytochrome c subunit
MRRFGLIGLFSAAAALLLTIAMLFTAGWSHPPVAGQQLGYRGTGMDLIRAPSAIEVLEAANRLPEAIAPADPGGQLAKDAYQNVQVLGDLTVNQFGRVMVAMTNWVAPQQGCAYCHNIENMADDGPYAKKAARRMLQMTRHINVDWKAHVASTGVVCYTCHRGNPVPAYVWFTGENWPQAGGFSTSNYGLGHPSAANGSSSLTQDPFPPLDEKSGLIRVQATQALPTQGLGASIQSAEQVYALMMSFSHALGVNCTFCHNAQDFGNWTTSTPQRVTAWQGIQMVRDLNGAFLDPLKDVLPENRMGPLGDGPKLNCATCHQGANKPLLGQSIAKDWPELGGAPAP